MISLKYDNFRFYWAEKKLLNSVNAKVSYLSTGILNDKSVFSPVIVYHEITQISEMSL